MKTPERIQMIKEQLQAAREILGNPETNPQDVQALSELEAELQQELAYISQTANDRKEE